MVISIVSLVFLVGITIFASIIGKKITHYTKVNFEVFGRLTNFVQETFSGIGVVKAFVLEKIQMLRFGKLYIDNMNSTLDITKASALMNTIINVILSLVNIIIIGYGGYIIYTNQNNLDITFTVGDLTKFISYFGSLIWPIEAVGRLIALRSQGQASLTRVSAVLDLKPAINDDLVEDESVMIEGKIEYRNLSFAYPTNPNIVLSDVSFTINKGEFVGIIGATGSGKTTLVDVLLRIYNIEEGSLFIDDVDIMKIPLKKVRDSIAYVPQDNFLFSDTIKKNIAFSSKEVDDEKVTSFSQIADIREDVLVFKDGFDTVLGERGVTVSGGQKQRISIARALYKDANILILDDSLSAVDTETEKNIITNLRDLRKGKTTIIIAHRITTLKDLDKIVVVENGCVTAVGKHEELVNCNSFYSNEVQLQKLEEEEK